MRMPKTEKCKNVVRLGEYGKPETALCGNIKLAGLPCQKCGG